MAKKTAEKKWGGTRPGAGRTSTKRATVEIGETVGIKVKHADGSQTFIELHRLVGVIGRGRDGKVLVLEPSEFVSGLE